MPNTKWVQNFKGYSDQASPGASPVITSDLSNVKVLHGQVRPRGGMNKYQSIAVAASSTIIGLMNYPRLSGTNSLLRMLENKVEHLTGGSWQDITGAALNGSVINRPQHTIIDDTLVFTNEGADLPRKWAGTGNTSSIASGTSPYGKTIAHYLGFLMLGNVSDSGTFTDVPDGQRIIRYSDDWDNDWEGCAGNEIILHETPGNLLRMLLLGRDLMCYKDDGLVRVTWVGGNVIFKHEKVDFDIGFVSPLGIARINDEMHIGLGNDGVLYVITQSEVTPISYDTLFRTLPPAISNGKQKYARMLNSPEEGLVYLFYDRTGLSGQLADSYVSYNYREKVFSKGQLGKQIVAAEYWRPTNLVPADLLISTPTLVNEFDNGTDDDGTVVTSYWTTGFQNLDEEGWFYGARLLFEKPSSSLASIDVSVAIDGSGSFGNLETIRLSGGSPGDDFVEVYYKPTTAIWCNWVNLKIRFKGNALTAGVELRRIGLVFEGKHPVRKTAERQQADLTL